MSEPGTCNFFHYSGHGGQVQDPTGNHPSGLLDTICPVDFLTAGQIDSDTLHTHLVSRLPPSSTLFVILDCCHSGSALESVSLPLILNRVYEEYYGCEDFLQFLKTYEMQQTLPFLKRPKLFSTNLETL